MLKKSVIKTVSSMLIVVLTIVPISLFTLASASSVNPFIDVEEVGEVELRIHSLIVWSNSCTITIEVFTD